METIITQSVIVLSVIKLLLICDVVTELSASRTETDCSGCHPTDPDAKRNVVSLQLLLIILWCSYCYLYIPEF